jgi:hypothetical protein
MTISPEEMDTVIIEINDLFDAVKERRGISYGRRGDNADIELVKREMGVQHIFELELILLKSLGPMHLLYPILSFDGVLEKDSSLFFQNVLNQFPEWQKLNWLPFCADGCGNYFVYPLTRSFEESRPILEIITNRSTIRPERVVASNLLRFFRRLLKGELEEDEHRFDDDKLQVEDATLAAVRQNFSIENVVSIAH